MEHPHLPWQSPGLKKAHNKRQPLVEESQNATQPTSPPATGTATDHEAFIWRTRSLDDSSRRKSPHGSSSNHDGEDPDENLNLAPPRNKQGHCDNNNNNNNEEEEDNVRNSSNQQQQALHSSFDASLLESDFHSIFRVSKRRASSSAASWHNDSTPHSSGRKHHRQPRSGDAFLGGEHDDEDELICPGTVRKLARHNSNESSKSKGTPVRPHWNATSTLSSSRLQQSTTTINNNKHNNNNNNARVWKPPRMNFPLTPTAPNSTSTANTLPSTTQPGQGPLLESAQETDSVGTNSPSTTPFRFTSFPASLPRVHPPLREKHTSGDLFPPDSVRKRMNFGFPPPSSSSGHFPTAMTTNLAATTTTHHNNAATTNSNNNNNNSREEEGTQNTSISSLSTHGEEDPRMPPVHTRLFPEEEYAYSDDDDDQEEEDDDDNVTMGRTRLNFNLLLSPKNTTTNNPEESPFKDLGEGVEKDVMKMPLEETEDDTYPTDLSRPYEQRHVHSFPSTMSSHTPLRNLSGCDEITTMSTIHNDDPPSSDHDPARAPATPVEVKLHFQFDAAQCSPIPGIPEEEEMRPRPTLLQKTKKSTSSRLPPKPHPPSTEPTLPPPSFKGTSGLPPTNTEDARTTFSQESVSSSSSSKLRRLRPMPDMSAFEMDSGSKNGHDRSIDDASGAMSAPSPKLLCPPTPVRTPAWAHTSSENESGSKTGGGPPHFHRSNSLTMTRVLATCSDPSYSSGPNAGRIGLFQGAADDATSMDQDMDMGSATAKPQAMQQQDDSHCSSSGPNHPEAPPRIRRSVGETGSIISFATDFETLGILGKGAFADVFKVRSKLDNRLYAVKRNRRHFRGKRDRDIALAEVRSMQRLQQEPSSYSTSPQQQQQNLQYLLFFYRAWQEDGHFFCQTELCCRDTCRELMDCLSTNWCVARTRYPSLLRHLPPPTGVDGGSPFDVAGRLVPDMSVWKICHDICAGLSHIHSRGLVHNDIKPSNIFFVSHEELGCLCKIGDFGMAGEVGSQEDGHEGDQKYMAPELLTSDVKHASSDLFSLGLTLYELAAGFGFELPKQGPRWHELRSGSHSPELSSSRDTEIGQLIQQMISPSQDKRPQADSILKHNKVARAGRECDQFLRDYIKDIDDYDRREEEHLAAAAHVGDEKTPRTGANGAPCRVRVCSPTLGHFSTTAPTLFTPEAQST